MSKRGREAEQLLAIKNQKIDEKKQRENMKNQKSKEKKENEEENKLNEKFKKVGEIMIKNISPISNKVLKKKFQPSMFASPSSSFPKKPCPQDILDKVITENFWETLHIGICCTLDKDHYSSHNAFKNASISLDEVKFVICVFLFFEETPKKKGQEIRDIYLKLLPANRRTMGYKRFEMLWRNFWLKV